MSRVWLVVCSFILCSSPLRAETRSCEKNILANPENLETLEIPARWNLPRKELDLLIEAKPELHAHLASLGRLEKFIGDAENLPFLDFLGAYIGVGFSVEAFPEDEFEDPIIHREKQLATIVNYAWHTGILDHPLDPQEICVLADAFGPLASQPVVDYTQMIRDPRMPGKLTSLVDARRDKLPRFLDLLLHSQSAQLGALDTFAQAGRLPPSMVKPMVAKLKARLFDDPVPETRAEAFILDMIVHIAHRDIPAFIAGAGSPGDLTRKRAIQMISKAEVGYVDTAFSAILRMFNNYVEAQSQKARRGILAYPLGVMGAFEKFLQLDVMADRGVTPELRRIFPELLFDAPVLTGFRAQKTIRAHLDRTLRETRDLFKEYRKVERATTDPNREERKREYAERLKTQLAVRDMPEDEIHAPAIPLEVFEAPPEPEYDLWTDLLDESRSIEGVIAAMREKLIPDQMLNLTLEKSGHRYRVEFSKRILEQMTDPGAVQVEDPREWLRAMRAGPARARGQQGWKKLNATINGVYDWEIKVLHSPFRMLGYKRSNKVWRFETIQDVH